MPVLNAPEFLARRKEIKKTCPVHTAVPVVSSMILRDADAFGQFGVKGKTEKPLTEEKLQ